MYGDFNAAFGGGSGEATAASLYGDWCCSRGGHLLQCLLSVCTVRESVGIVPSAATLVVSVGQSRIGCVVSAFNFKREVKMKRKKQISTHR